MSFGLLAPFGVYPVLVMQLWCFALFACAFNLLLGYTGVVSFGHAAFFGGSAYIAGHAMARWGFPPIPGILLGVAFASRTPENPNPLAVTVSQNVHSCGANRSSMPAS